MGAERCAWVELLAAHALDALDRGELDGLEAHLRSRCAECEGELARMRREVEALAESPDPVAPPPLVRSRVLNAARPRLRSGGARGPRGSEE